MNVVYTKDMETRNLIDAKACVYQDLDAHSRHTKSAQKIASYVVIPFLTFSVWVVE